MEFGVGLLGQGWTIEEATERLLESTTPANPNFHLFSANYAAKVAAETVLSDHPSIPDLTDEGIVRRCAACARPVRMTEAPMVREAFLSEYKHYLEVAA